MLARALRRTIRLPAMVVMLFAGLAITLGIFPLLGHPRRDAIIARWSRLLMRATGVRIVERAHERAAPLSSLHGPAMLAANHVAWLDIFVIHALRPSAFIAKADIARWPLLGLLVARAGTLFLERGRRHAVRDALHRVAGAFEAQRVVAVFPEGTVGDGERLLPFHANLLQAAVHAQAPVVPVGLRYLAPDGTRSDAVFYAGEVTFVESVWRIVGERSVTAEVHAFAPIATGAGTTRHDVSAHARHVISAGLGLPLEDTLPEKLRDLRVAPR